MCVQGRESGGQGVGGEDVMGLVVEDFIALRSLEHVDIARREHGKRHNTARIA